MSDFHDPHGGEVVADTLCWEDGSVFDPLPLEANNLLLVENTHVYQDDDEVVEVNILLMEANIHDQFGVDQILVVDTLCLEAHILSLHDDNFLLEVEDTPYSGVRNLAYDDGDLHVEEADILC